MNRNALRPTGLQSCRRCAAPQPRTTRGLPNPGGAWAPRSRTQQAYIAQNAPRQAGTVGGRREGVVFRSAGGVGSGACSWSVRVVVVMASVVRKIISTAKAPMPVGAYRYGPGGKGLLEVYGPSRLVVQ